MKLMNLNLKKRFGFAHLMVLLNFYFSFLGVSAQSNDWVLTDEKSVYILDLEVDSNGDLITLGYIYGAYGQVDIDPGPGQFILESYESNWPQFLRKIDSNGELVWIVVLDSDFGKMELDDANNIYLLATFSSEFDADPTSGSLIFNANPLNENISDGNIALAKLDGSASFLWAKHLTQGGNTYDYGFELLEGGGISVVGSFRDTVDFDSGSGEYLLSHFSNIESDGFLLRLDSDGNFKWVAHLDGQPPESNIIPESLIEDLFGNIYISGRYYGAVDFDTSLAGPELIEELIGAHFIAKYDSLGNFIWVKENGKDYFNSGNIIYDSDLYGNIYIGGDFKNTSDFSPGSSTYNVTSVGDADIFIQKIDSLGNLVWLKQFGGLGADQLGSLTVDDNGNIYHYGVFEGEADLDPGAGVINVTAYGNGFYEELIIGGPSLPDKVEVVPAADTYVQKINNSGIIEWTGQIGGKEDDNSNTIQCDEDGNIILTGLYYGGVDFRPGSDSLIGKQIDLYYHSVIAKLTPPLEGLTPVYVPEQPTFYPNPANSVLLINTGHLYETYKAKLINISGEVVFQDCCVTENSAIAVDYLTSGVYILYLYGEDETYAFKIVIAH
jgi:hypothetical protein